jgi:glycosyltransferase involved in cell wall biosynthesis
MKFSIIIPLYNKQNYIVKTLESVLSQSYKDFEVIVVNDGSSDNSLQEALSVSDSRIRVINKENGGVSSARNLGIHEAKNEWICFLDADDIMYPNCLEEYFCLHTEFPNISVLCASVDISIKQYPSLPKRYIVSNYYKANIYSEMRTGMSLLCTDCICIHKTCFESVGLFNPRFTHGEDLNLWDRLQAKYKFAKSEVSVAYYDMSAENRSDSVAINSNRHFLPELFVNKPSFREPFYKHLIYGGREYYNILAEKTPIMRFKKLLPCIGDVLSFIVIKTIVRMGLITSRGIS